MPVNLNHLLKNPVKTGKIRNRGIMVFEPARTEKRNFRPGTKDGVGHMLL